MRRRAVLGMMLVVGLFSTAVEASAQRRIHTQPAGHFDFSFLVADAKGELGYFFDQAFGAQIGFAFPIDEDGYVRLKVDGGLLVYGLERQRFCHALPFGCRINEDLTTTNNIAFAGMGPEIVLARGAVEPYAFATMGLSAFFTSSSFGDDEYGDSFSTTHLADVIFAWRAGGGLRVRIANGHKPVSLDFGVERHENGVTEFLTKGDIVDHPDGSISLFPNVSEANLLTFRFGISIGFPQQGDRRKK